MNKYEKAIDIVARYCSDYRMGIFPPRNKLSNELDILDELVARATPKKLVKYEELSCANYLCPICENAYGDNVNNRKYIKYCPICGQRLDWSDKQ